MLGQAHARRQMCDRVARLFPKTNGAELRAITDFILSPWQMDTHHDMLGVTDAILKMNGLLGDAAVHAKRGADSALRVRTLYAIIGELHVVTSRTRPTAVAGREAADSLVLTVLATHALENIISEILHHVLQKIVEDSTPVWKDFKQSLAAIAMTTTRPASPSLASAPSNPLSNTEIGDHETSAAFPFWFVEDVQATRRVTQTGFTPKCQWTDVTRSGSLDVTVSNPAKGATFAMLMPKLAAKAKTSRGP